MENLTSLLSKFLKVLADPIRLQIIDYIENNPVSASKIQKSLKLSQSYTSHQLKKLVEMNILDFERKGKEKIFKIKYQGIHKLISLLKSYIIDIEKKKYEDFKSLKEFGEGNDLKFELNSF
jgi:ArsR family transcriptional regulator